VSIPKLTREERAERVAQVVEGLPSKCEALSSNHSTIKKREKEHSVDELNSRTEGAEEVISDLKDRTKITQ
jgi:hypothetical protein